MSRTCVVESTFRRGRPLVRAMFGAPSFVDLKVQIVVDAAPNGSQNRPRFASVETSKDAPHSPPRLSNRSTDGTDGRSPATSTERLPA